MQKSVFYWSVKTLCGSYSVLSTSSHKSFINYLLLITNDARLIIFVIPEKPVRKSRHVSMCTGLQTRCTGLRSNHEVCRSVMLTCLRSPAEFAEVHGPQASGAISDGESRGRVVSNLSPGFFLPSCPRRRPPRINYLPSGVHLLMMQSRRRPRPDPGTRVVVSPLP